MAETPRTLVCSKCLRACCWHGEWRCDDSREAGLLRATEAQLCKLGREHPDYFMPHLREGHDNPRERLLTDAMVEAAMAAGSPWEPSDGWRGTSEKRDWAKDA